MNEELNKAMEQISDKHIAEAAAFRKKRHRPYWVAAVAAVLVVALLAGIWGRRRLFIEETPRPTIQGIIHPDIPTSEGIRSPHTLNLTNLCAAPTYPVMVQKPHTNHLKDEFEWRVSLSTQYSQPEGYADNLHSFFRSCTQEFLSGEGNQIYSPANAYLALAMLAECANGNSRQQILNLLNADSIESLRTQVGHVWNATYRNDGFATSLMANSLWMDDTCHFDDGTVQTLANSYYASVFHGDLGTDSMNEQLRQWTNSQTGGLLDNSAQNTEMSPNTVFSLISTAYFDANWKNEFNPKDTSEGVFYCKDFDQITQFMHQSNFDNYYRGENFGAVQLPLNGSHTMWLFLPDEGANVADVVNSDISWAILQGNNNLQYAKFLHINISLPKFDINSTANLINGFQKLGITDIFDSSADFSTITKETNIYTQTFEQSSRIAIDEQGIVGAAYTYVDNAYLGVPQEKVDFILNRPFMFVITGRDNLPLFVGVVEQP